MTKKKKDLPALTLEQFKLYLAILECKLAYYYPSELHPSWNIKWPSDPLYDSWETRLKTLGVEVVGFPWNEHEGFVVWKLLSEPRKWTSWTELLMREAP